MNDLFLPQQISMLMQLISKYNSHCLVTRCYQIDSDKAVNFPVEFLNSLDLLRISPHNMKLKIGLPIISLRNLNARKLCNDIRLVIKKGIGNVPELPFLSSKFQGKNILLPWIHIIPSDSPIPFRRLQFLIATNNK